MTIIAGFKCYEGIVICADTAAAGFKVMQSCRLLPSAEEMRISCQEIYIRFVVNTEFLVSR